MIDLENPWGKRRVLGVCCSLVYGRSQEIENLSVCIPFGGKDLFTYLDVHVF